ncbi:Neuroblastoma breakpoint family member 6-like protein [Galemys pyrenaicus]|uniref:Neuroblastoma breakpoint family member 6-like protein n=1 Tax=Galemys pyrenaicus TaxID=202257 RepID=A0A8J6ADU7_GALPY|nr:Neuroblastoma breakpoint family member 6-like protein [Galemys pyrenaicus]
MRTPGPTDHRTERTNRTYSIDEQQQQQQQREGRSSREGSGAHQHVFGLVELLCDCVPPEFQKWRKQKNQYAETSSKLALLRLLIRFRFFFFPTSFSMAAPPPTFSGPTAEMSILETNQFLRSELEKIKQNFRDLTEKFLTSRAIAYALANQLQKYKCEEYKALTESVLEEQVLSEEGSPAEETKQAASLGSYDSLIQAQARELTQLRKRIQDGKVVCYLFTQHVKLTVKSFEALLRCTDIAHSRGQRLCQQLAQGSQLAESLASKLTARNAYGKVQVQGQGEATFETVIPTLLHISLRVLLRQARTYF